MNPLLSHSIILEMKKKFEFQSENSLLAVAILVIKSEAFQVQFLAKWQANSNLEKM